MKAINEIKLEFQELTESQCLKDYELFCELYKQDERAGVKALVNRCYKSEEALKKEMLRMEQMKTYEKKYSQYQYIAGVDEVGRGPLAGPVVTCAVILPQDCDLLYINDSKQVPEKKRETLAEQIKETAIACELGIVDQGVIDDINILQATYQAMRYSISNLSVQPELVLVDAVSIPELLIRQIPIVKGDTKSISIAAASIVAKVARDHMMEEFDKIYPEYDFASNKGYGTKKHIDAIKQYGPCPLHRKEFIKNFI